MIVIASRSFFTRKMIQLAFLIFCTLFLCDHAFSRKHFNPDYIEVAYSIKQGAIYIRFKFFDYDFGPCGENGYLEYCDFDYTKDLSHYTRLMSCGTNDQRKENWSWVRMTNKLPGAKIIFIGSRVPASGSLWADGLDYKAVEVPHSGNEASFVVKWVIDDFYRDIKYIRIRAKWHCNGIYRNDVFNSVHYKVVIPKKTGEMNSYSKEFKTEENAVISKTRAVNVYSEQDVIVVKGAEGETVKVFDTSGAQVKSIFVNNDVIKIRLPANRVYIVGLGQMRYKVAL